MSFTQDNQLLTQTQDPTQATTSEVIHSAKNAGLFNQIIPLLTQTQDLPRQPLVSSSYVM